MHPQSTTPCAARSCRRINYAHGLCVIHAAPRRFWAKVDKRRGPIWNGSRCWIWTGSVSHTGSKDKPVYYGQIRIDGRRQGVHRLAFELAKGPIPKGLTIDHLCRNTLCVNPDHLEAVTQRINGMRGTSMSAQHAKKTHCPQGHPYDLFNTYRPARGGRQCRTCITAQSSRRWKALKTARAAERALQ